MRGPRSSARGRGRRPRSAGAANRCCAPSSRSRARAAPSSARRTQRHRGSPRRARAPRRPCAQRRHARLGHARRCRPRTEPRSAEPRASSECAARSRRVWGCSRFATTTSCLRARAERGRASSERGGAATVVVVGVRRSGGVKTRSSPSAGRCETRAETTMRFLVAVGSAEADLVASCRGARGRRALASRGRRRVDEAKPNGEGGCVEPEAGERREARLCGCCTSRRQSLSLTVGAATLRCASGRPWCVAQTKTGAPAAEKAPARPPAPVHVREDGGAGLARVPAGHPVTRDEVFGLIVDSPLHPVIAAGALGADLRLPVRREATTNVGVSASLRMNERPTQGVRTRRSGPFSWCGLAFAGSAGRPPCFVDETDVGADAGARLHSGVGDAG